MTTIAHRGMYAAMLLLAVFGPACQAQDLGSLFHSVADSATQKAEQKVAQKAANHITDAIAPSANAVSEPRLAASREVTAQGRRPMPVITGGSDFSPAPLTLYQDDFDTATIGSLPRHWRTNGSGRVVNVQGFDGKWLALNAGSTFKLARTASLPQRYTVEFDLIAAGNEPGDVGTVYVGFASNNSVKDYLQGGAGNGALNALAIQFGNSTPVSALSGATGHSATADFPVDDYLNRALHVSISVNSDQEQIWLDGSKVLDSRMFDRNASRYVFFSAPWTVDHHAQVMIGHVRIATYP